MSMNCSIPGYLGVLSLFDHCVLSIWIQCSCPRVFVASVICHSFVWIAHELHISPLKNCVPDCDVMQCKVNGIVLF